MNRNLIDHIGSTDKRDLGGVRLEFIAPFPGLTAADDGSVLTIAE